jgi:hypothetical protein
MSEICRFYKTRITEFRFDLTYDRFLISFPFAAQKPKRICTSANPNLEIGFHKNLVHSAGRCENSQPTLGYVRHFEQPLYRSVLAVCSVENGKITSERLKLLSLSNLLSLMSRVA